ncbi:MAG: molybdopterin-dependent oxidoreductase [Candidatus Thorarchaeota archaeon]
MEEIVRYGTCTKDCYGSCVFEGIWNDNAIEHKFIYAKPLKNHPFTNGFFCSKYNNRQDLLYHPVRLKKPLTRISQKPENNFKVISSQRALEIIAQKVIEIKEKRQEKSIIGAFYAGNSGLISMYSPLRFFTKLGCTVTSAGLCNEGGCESLKKIFGTYSISNPFQIINPATHLIVIWGSNLSESNIHAYFLVKQAIKNGTEVIVIDSRNTQVAKKSNFFIQINPGTEHLITMLLIKELSKQNVIDVGFLKENVDSYSFILSKVEKIDEHELLSQIGIKFESLHEFVNLLIKHKHHTLFMIGYGVQKDFYGGRIVQSIALVQILLGNIGKKGTGLLYSQSDYVKPIIGPILNYISQSTMNLNTMEIPLISLGKALSTGDYKLLFVYNFNPVSSLPNQNLLREALLNKDLFVVVLDLFLNETTNYADIVLPAKFDLETSDIITPYYFPSLSINFGGPCPYPDCMSNYEFFRRLALKVGYIKSPIFKESGKDIFDKALNMLPKKIYKNLISKGYHLLFDQAQVPYKNLKFPTQNHKIQVQDITLRFGENELKKKYNRKKNEFILISPSHPYFLHSQLGLLNSKYYEDFGRIFLNPDDILGLDLDIDKEVIVYNEYGSAEYILAELPSLKSGTALIYSGASSPYYTSTNVNLFTPDIPEESGLSGAYYSTLIQIKKVN